MQQRRSAHWQASSIADDFAHAVRKGLSRPQKSIPCRFLYDAKGSELFERITALPEYYPTRTEHAILQTNAQDIANAIHETRVLIELGSGSSLKTEVLLKALPQDLTYVPIDVSETALAEAAQRLQRRFPTLDIRPLIANFSSGLKLPRELPAGPRTAFFPGSTIGNFRPPEARRLLASLRDLVSLGGRLVIGVDLKKDPQKLILAYADPRGITAAFNLNILARINRDLDGSFDLAAFRHEAIYNEIEGRIEMRLVSTRDQVVRIGTWHAQFREGEPIHTENAYKYSVPEFQALAVEAGWQPQQVWVDPETLFSVHQFATA